MAKKKMTVQTPEAIKKATIEAMEELGTYKPQYDQLIDIYAGLVHQYQKALRDFEAGGCIYEVETGAGGEAASIRIYGVSKVVAAEAIDPGEEVASDADGKAKVAGSGDRVLGVALTAAANEDEIISIALYHGPELA